MKVVIYGRGDFAELMAYYFKSDSKYEIVAFCVDKSYMSCDKMMGYPVVEFENVDKLYPVESYEIFVAVGYKSMRQRKKMYERVKEKGYTCASYISSKAILDDSNNIGENCIVLQGAILEPFATIGSNTYVNSGVMVCHHTRVDEHCFLAAKCLLGGLSHVKENSFIGFNATVLQKLCLGKESLLGAGSVLNIDTDAYTKYIGIPAKKMGTHSLHGIEIID